MITDNQADGDRCAGRAKQEGVKLLMRALCRMPRRPPCVSALNEKLQENCGNEHQADAIDLAIGGSLGRDVVVDMFRIGYPEAGIAYLGYFLHRTRQCAAYLDQVQYNQAADLIELIDFRPSGG